MGMKNSHDKLKANIPEFERIKNDLKAVFQNTHLELDKLKDKFLQKVEILEATVASHVEAVLAETTANAYRSDYQPTSHLAYRVWEHCTNQSSDPIPIFEWRLQSDLQTLEHCVGFSVYTPFPELTGFNSPQEVGLMSKLTELETRVQQENDREAALWTQYQWEMEVLRNEKERILAEKDAITKAKNRVEVDFEKAKQTVASLKIQLESQEKSHREIYEQLQRDLKEQGKVITAKSKEIGEKCTEMTELQIHLKEMKTRNDNMNRLIKQYEGNAAQDKTLREEDLLNQRRKFSEIIESKERKIERLKRKLKESGESIETLKREVRRMQGDYSAEVDDSYY